MQPTPRITLRALLGQFAEHQRPDVQAALIRPDVDGAVFWRERQAPRLTVYGPGTVHPDAVRACATLATPLGLYDKRTPVGASRVAQALQLIDRDGLGVRQAARELGIDPAAVSRARKAAATRPVCPCCGRLA